ncbi:PKD-like domain-containing protein [Neolewinella persica]|uniref:PKD-like domain-containing protein n=1 Tax=Neolewinella persica TaxID=70998 RepID=UPI00035C20A7|nr:PKD-like domain-containing protein [Neolewinella persica]
MKNFTPVCRSLFLAVFLLLSFGSKAQTLCGLDPNIISVTVENTCSDAGVAQNPYVTIDFNVGSINGPVNLSLESIFFGNITLGMLTVDAVANFGIVTFELPGFVLPSGGNFVRLLGVTELSPGGCEQTFSIGQVQSNFYDLTTLSQLSITTDNTRTIDPPCMNVPTGKASIRVAINGGTYANNRFSVRLEPYSPTAFVSVIPPGTFPNPNMPNTGYYLIESNQSLVSGTYTFLIFDNQTGCEVAYDVEVGDPAAEFMVEGSTTPVTCFGDSDGTITVDVDDADPNINGVLSYIITQNGQFVRNGTLTANNMGYQPQTESGLTSGLYLITLTAQNGGCMDDQTVFIGSPAEIVATGVVAPTICADASLFDLNIASITGISAGSNYRLIDGSNFDNNVTNNGCWTRPTSGRSSLSTGANGDGSYTFTLGTSGIGFCRSIDQDTTVAIVLEIQNGSTGCVNLFPFTLQIDAQPDTTETSHSAMAGSGEITGGFYCSGQDINLEIADYDAAFTYDIAYTSVMDVTGDGAFAATMFNYTGTGSVVGSFNNATNSAKTIDFTVTKESNATGCVSVVENFSLMVRPLPVVDPILNDEVIVCSGEEFESDDITLNGDGGNANVRFNYNWTFGPELTIAGAISGTDNESDDSVVATFTNTSGMAQVATLTITPTFPQTSPAVGGGQLDNTCEGESRTITVTVSPRPTLSYDLNIGGLSTTLTGGDVEAYEICNGDDFQLNNLMIPEDHAGNKAKYVRYRVFGDARFLQIDQGGPYELGDVQTTQFLPIDNFAIGQTNIQNNHPANNAQVAQIVLTPYFEDEVGGPDFPLCRGEAIRIFLTLNPTAPALISPQTDVVCSDERIEYRINGASGSGMNLETRITQTNVFSGVTDAFYVVPEGANRIENFSFNLTGANGGGTTPTATTGRSGGLGAIVSGGLDENELLPGDTIRIRKGLAGAANNTNGAGGDATLLTVTAGTSRSMISAGDLLYTFVAAGGGGAGNGENGRNARTFTMDMAANGMQGQGPGGFGGTGTPTSLGGAGNVNGGGGGGGHVGGNGGNSQSGQSGQGGASFRSPANDLATFALKTTDGAAEGEASIFYTVVYDDIRFSLAQPVDVPAGLTSVGEVIVDGEVDTILYGQQFVNMTDTAINVTYLFNTTTEANCNGGQVEVIITVEPVPTASIVSDGTIVTGDAINGFEATVCSGDPINALLQSMTIPSNGVGDLRFMVDVTTTDANIQGNNTGRASSGNFDSFYSGDDLDIPFFENRVRNNNGVEGTIVYTITPVIEDHGSIMPTNMSQPSINYCFGEPFTFTVTVEPGFTPDLNPAQFDVCSGENLGAAPFDLEADQADDVNVAFSSIRLVGYRISSMDPNFTAVSVVDTTGLANGGVILTQAGNYFENDTYRNLTGAGVTVEYDIQLISDAGCESDVITYDFLIRAEPVISTANTAVTVCEGEATGLRTFPAPNSAFNSTWTNTSNVTFTYDLDPGNLIYLGNVNYPVGGAGVGAFRFQNDAFENPTSIPQTATYTVFATTRFGCVGAPVTYTVTVLPDPELTADVVAGGVAETLTPQDDAYIYELCSGDDFSLGGLDFTSIGIPGRAEYVEFSFFSNGGSNFFNIPNGTELVDASGFLIGAQNVTNTTNTPYFAFITLTPYLESDTNNPSTAGECIGDEIQITVLLNPEVTANGPGGVPTPQEINICSDEPISSAILSGSNSILSFVRGSHDFATDTDFVFPDNANSVNLLQFELSSANGGGASQNGTMGALGAEVDGVFNFIGGIVQPGDTLRAILGQPGADGVMAGAGGGGTSLSIIGGPNSMNEGGVIGQVVVGGGAGAGSLNSAVNNLTISNSGTSSNGLSGAGPGGNGGSGAPTFAGGAGNNNGGGGGGGWIGGDGGSSTNGIAGTSGASYQSNNNFSNSIGLKDVSDDAAGSASITFLIAYDDVRFTVVDKEVPALLDASGAQLGVGDSGLDTLLYGETFVNNEDTAQVVTYTLSTSTEAGCPGTEVIINVTVEPNPTIMLASSGTMISEDSNGNYSAEICSGDSLSAILSSMTIPSTGVGSVRANVVDVTTGPDISFNTSNGARASGPNGNFGGTNSPAQDDIFFFERRIRNNGTEAQNVVYTVVPRIVRQGAANCFGDTLRLTVTVYPEFVGVDDAPAQVSLCSNVSLDDSGFDIDATQTITNMIAYDSIIIDTVYNDVALVNAANFETISSVYSGTPVTVRRSEGFFGMDTYRNRTGGGAIVTYEVRLVSGPGCFSETITYNFRYTAEPVISLVETNSYQLDTVICNLDNTGLVVNPAPNSAWGTSFADFNNNVDLEFEAVIPMGVILTNGTYPATGSRTLMANDVLENTTDAPLDVVYTVSPFNNGCAGDPVTYTVTVNPNPDATVQLTSLDSTATFSLENSRAFLNPNPAFGMCSGQALTTTVPAAATAANGTLMAAMTISVDDDGLSGYTVGTTMVFPASELGDSLSYAAGEIMNLSAGAQFFTVRYTTYFEANGTVNNQNDGVDCGSDGTVEFDVVVSPANIARVDVRVTNDAITDPIPTGLDTLCSGELFDLAVRTASSIANDPDLPAIDSFIVQVDATGLTAGAGTEDGEFTVAAPFENPAFYFTRLDDLSFTNSTAGIKTVTYIATPYSAGCAGIPDTTTISFRPEVDLELNEMVLCAQTGVGTSIFPIDANEQILTMVNADYRWEYAGGTASGFALTRSNGNNPTFVGDPVLQAGTIVYNNEQALIITPSGTFMPGVVNFEVTYDNLTNGNCGSVTEIISLNFSTEANSGTLDPLLGVQCDGVNFLLTNALLGETEGGVFTDANGAPLAGGANYTPMIGGSDPMPVAVEFTYTVGGGNSGCAVVSTTFSVMVEPAPNAGSYVGTPGEACQSAVAFNLFDLLTDAMPGGVFTQTAGIDFIAVGSDGIFNQGSATPGTYTYDYEVTSANGCGSDVVSGISVEVVSLVDCSTAVPCDTINLLPGFNVISFTALPEDASVENIFADDIAVNNLLSIFAINPITGTPGSYNYNPVFGTTSNTVGPILDGFGYIVEVDQATTIITCGIAADTSLRVELINGLNIVGYTKPEVQTAINYFSTLIGAGDLNQVRTVTEAGNFELLRFNPLDGNNILMNASQGYLLDVTADYAPGTWRDREQMPTSNFDRLFGYTNVGSEYEGQFVRLQDAAGNVYGKFAVGQDGTYDNVILFGDLTETTDMVEGFAYGEEIFAEFRGEVIATGVTFDGAWNLRQMNLNFNAANSVQEPSVVDEFSMKVFPNPTEGLTKVNLELDQDYKMVRVEVYGLLGQVVAERELSNQLKGQLTVDLQLHQLPAGAYVVRVLTNDGVKGHTQIIRK